MYTLPLYCTSTLHTFSYTVLTNHKSRVRSPAGGLTDEALSLARFVPSLAVEHIFGQRSHEPVPAVRRRRKLDPALERMKSLLGFQSLIVKRKDINSAFKLNLIFI